MYVLAECGLIHKYLLKKEDVKRIEEETFFTVTIVKELDGYEVIEGENKITLSNGEETLVFKKAERAIWDFAYYLDEYSLEVPTERTNSMNEDKKKGNIVYLTGEAKERVHIGTEVIEQFFKETNIKETMNKSGEVLKIIEFIKNKKENCDIDDVIDVIRYGQSYAANVKDWKETDNIIKGKLKITGDSSLDIKIEEFLARYIDYIQEAIQNAKEGKSIDNKAINALGDSVRSIHCVKRLMQDPKESLGIDNLEVISDRKTNIKIQCIILSYISYVKDAIANLRNGTQIDEKSINTLGEAIRDIHSIKKMIERTVEPLD